MSKGQESSTVENGGGLLPAFPHFSQLDPLATMKAAAALLLLALVGSASAEVYFKETFDSESVWGPLRTSAVIRRGPDASCGPRMLS